MASIQLGGSVGTTGTSILGSVTIVNADATYTLSVAEYTNQYINVTGTLTAQRNVIAPLTAGVNYIVNNITTGGFGIQFIGPSGTGVVVANGSRALVVADGTNFNLVGSSSTSFTAGGDLSGTNVSQTVIKINGSTVPAGGSLTTGNGLYVTGSSALSYSALNLAGGANYVTGVLPTANQAAQTLAGDVTGTTAASVVAKVNGTTYPAGGSLTTGTIPRVTGSATVAYGALDLANSSAVTGVLPVGNQAAQNLSGDATGTTAAVVNTQARGLKTATTTVSVSASAAPSANQVLVATNSTTAAWAAVPGGSSPGGTAGGDLSGTYPNPTVAKVNGTTITTAGGGLVIGRVLRATSTSIADWGAVDLANTFAVTGTLPAGNQAAQSLGGDLSGTTSSANVIKLRGTPVSATAPTTNQVLFYNGTNWIPGTIGSSIPTGVTWANDLVGSTDLHQYVASISGNAGAGGTVPINASALQYDSLETSVSILQAAKASGSGATFTIQAQTASNGALGGGLTLSSGANTVVGASAAGPVIIQTGAVNRLAIHPTVVTYPDASFPFPYPLSINGYSNISCDLLQFTNDLLNPIIWHAPLPTTSSTSGTVGQFLYIIAQTGQAATGASHNGGTGGNLVLRSGDGGTSGSATAGIGGDVIISSGSGSTAGNVRLQTDGTTRLIVEPTSVSLQSLQGSGSGYVAVNNSGTLSFTATANPGGTAGGDLSGTYPNPTVAKIQNAPANFTSIATGNAIVYTASGGGQFINSAIALGGGANWVSGILPAANQAAQTMTGDVTGTTAASVVTSISGANPIPINTQVLQWNNTVSAPFIDHLSLASTSSTSGATGQVLSIVAQAGQAATGAAHNGGNGGNLILSSGSGGTSGSATPGTAGSTIIQTGGVARVTVSSTSVTLQSLAGSGSGYVAVDNGGVLSFTSGIAPSGAAGGDLSGTYPNPTVAKINATTISTAGGALTTGKVLRVTGSATADWGAVDLANSSAVTGVLPTANQAAQTMAGDVTGTTAASVVAAITGGSGVVNIASTGNIFTWNNATTAPGITQTALASTSGGSGAAGANISVTAQAGQAATGASNNGGNGGDVILTAGAGGTSGSATAGVGGKISLVGGQKVSVSGAKTSSYTVTRNDYIILIGTLTASITITLPASPATGDTYIIKTGSTCNQIFRNDAGTLTTVGYIVTVTPSSGNIDGQSSWYLSTPYVSTTFVYTGSEWSII